MAMSNNDIFPIPASAEELRRINMITAEYVIDIGKRVEEARLSPQEGIDLINDRLSVIDKQIMMPGGKVFMPLKLLCIEVRNVVLRHLS